MDIISTYRKGKHFNTKDMPQYDKGFVLTATLEQDQELCLPRGAEVH
jgi:hypothetical protein